MSSLKFEVVGVEGPKKFFSRLTRETIAHAYLFTGPPGVGKKTFARRLGQSLLCEGNTDSVLGYDGTCASCKLIGKEETRHPDLLESSGALKIGDTDEGTGFFDQAEVTSRDLVRQLSLQSYSGGLRIFILGDLDFASPAAANALLKFFEDPPKSVVLLATTAAPARLIATIRSRLVEVRFRSLRRDEVAEILRERGFSKKDAGLGAKLSQGSVTRAVAALSEDEEQLRAQVADWFFEVVEGKTPPDNWATRETLDEGLEIVKTLLRDWLATRVKSAVLAEDYAADIKKLGVLDERAAINALAKISDAQRLAATNVSPALVSEVVRMSLNGLAA